MRRPVRDDVARLLDEDRTARRTGAVLARLSALGVQAGNRIAVLAGNIGSSGKELRRAGRLLRIDT